MSDNNKQNPIQINKYPNRRYYDTQNSRHITLQEVYDLIVSGKDVCVTDSRSGEDLTNVVLLQILLERDQPKLDVFPSSVLHMVIRSNRQVLRTTMERFFGPFLGMVAASQRQFDAYVRNTMSGRIMNPLEWTREMMRAFSGGFSPASGPQDQNPPNWSAADEDSRDRKRDHVEDSEKPDGGAVPSGQSSELNELRAQIEALRRRFEESRTQES